MLRYHPAPRKPDILIITKEIKQVTQRLSARGLKLCIAVEYQLRVGMGGTEQIVMRHEIGEAEIGHAALAHAENVTAAAQFQILLGNAEATFTSRR